MGMIQVCLSLCVWIMRLDNAFQDQQIGGTIILQTVMCVMLKGLVFYFKYNRAHFRYLNVPILDGNTSHNCTDICLVHLVTKASGYGCMSTETTSISLKIII